MIDPTLNAAVIAVAGVFNGGLTFVAGSLDPVRAHGRPPAPPPLFRRGYFKALRERQKAEEAARALAPRSYNVALGAFAGLIVVTALGIYLSPIHMRWLFFIAGWFGGFLVLNGVYALALQGRLPVKLPAFLDRLASATAESDEQNTTAGGATQT